MGLYDNRRSNISKQSAQSKALKRQKAAERRERRQTEGPQFEVTGAQVLIFITAVLTVAYFAGLLPDP
jgi:hypothetical protein